MVFLFCYVPRTYIKSLFFFFRHPGLNHGDGTATMAGEAKRNIKTLYERPVSVHYTVNTINILNPILSIVSASYLKVNKISPSIPVTY